MANLSSKKSLLLLFLIWDFGSHPTVLKNCSWLYAQASLWQFSKNQVLEIELELSTFQAKKKKFPGLWDCSDIKEINLALNGPIPV